MGTTTTRITAEDFLTPPEFSRWTLATSLAGRIGGVRLELAPSRDETSFSQCYQQIPLRVLPPFRFGPGQPSLVYLLNPTAGLMDGDAHLIEIRARGGARALVTGQSATRIHPASHGFSTQQWHIHVEGDAVLVVLPGPAIPFQGTRYYQHVRIDLENGGRLIWGDLWYAGRYARGEISERFQFETLIQDFTVHRGRHLVFRDRFAWQGPWDAEAATWHFGTHNCCGSLFVTGNIEESLIAEKKDRQMSLFPTKAGDTCLRWLGSSQNVAEGLVTTALKIAGILSGGQSSKPWLLPFHHLAPNHWFVPAYSLSLRELTRDSTSDTSLR